jgi:hypothetical protein
VNNRLGVGWTRQCDECLLVELEKPIYIATPKFANGKKIYMNANKSKNLSVAALKKMPFLTGVEELFDPETLEVTLVPILGEPGFIGAVPIAGQFFYDKAQNAAGFVADKLYYQNGDNPKEACIMENAIVNYKQKPQHLTQLKEVMLSLSSEALPDYVKEHIRKKSAGTKKISYPNNNNTQTETVVTDAEMLRYSHVSTFTLKGALYWDEAAQQFGLFMETLEFEMGYTSSSVPKYMFTKPAAH